MATKKKSSPHPIVPKRRGRVVEKQSYRRGPSLMRRAIKWMFILGLWGMIALVCIGLWFAKDLPTIAATANFERRPSITVKAVDGSLITRYGEMKRNSVKAKDLPPYLVQAVLATEDRRFYSHFGVDPLGIARAMVINLVKGHFVQGGSTITQQLAKNLFLSQDRKMTRKIQEALLALWLEYSLTKDEILTAYMNRVYLGSGVYGMPAAAEVYFGKNVKDINIREAAILAGLLKAPSKYSPLNNPKLAKERSDVVLAAMLDAGYLTKKEIAALDKAPARARIQSSDNKDSRYFADWVIDGVDDIIGTPDMDIVIETTLDPVIQSKAEDSLVQALLESGKQKNISQGAVLAMRPNGAVLAMVGGRDYNASEFNRTTQALRSPGSSFKPFVFLAALERGWTPSSHVLDAPITEGSYRPENFGGEYFGQVNMADALANSMNTATFRIAKSIGVNAILDITQRLGIISKMEPDMSICLGSSGISMMEMVTAYAIIANGGNRVYPYAITKITTTDGRVLFQREEPDGVYNVVGPQYTRALSYMMQGVVQFGTGQRAKLPFPVSGKTGTSQESRDAWFIGFSDQVVAAVWLGNDDNRPMNKVTGGSVPASIWHEVMAYSNGRYPAISYSAPDLISAEQPAYEGDQPQQDQSSSTSGEDSSSGGIGGLIESLLGGSDTDNNQHRTEKSAPRDDFSNLNN